MGIREERRRERRSAVLDAAMSIIETDGASAVTIAAVAQRIGASVGGMYRYFPTKHAIFAALQLRAIDAFEEHLLTHLEAASQGTALERVALAFSTWMTFRDVAPTHYRLLDESLSSMERTLDDEQASAVNERLHTILTHLADTIETAVAVEELRPGDAMIRTHLLWSALHGLGHFEKRDHLQPERLRVAALETTLYETFFSSWGASAATPS